MKALRYGIVGGGFISAFQLRALGQVRGVEVAGLVSRRPPEQLAAYVHQHGLGEGRIFSSIKEMAPRSIKFVCLLAAPEGIAYLQEEHPDITIFTAAIDEKLNEHGYIIPGLGDAGDRLFGTK